MITTRGRYALQALIDLAEHNDGEYIPLKEIAVRQNISLKYLEQIMRLLNNAGLVKSSSGKGGGYKLNRTPSEYTVGDVLRVTERITSPVACFENNTGVCDHPEKCRTHQMWERYWELINNFFNGITVADLTNKSQNMN